MRDEDFERLYAAEAQGLFGFLVYRTGDRALAEDLLADTFERALRSRKRYDRRRGPAKAWLYTIALNLLRDHARRGGRGPAGLAGAGGGGAGAEGPGPGRHRRRSAAVRGPGRGPARAPRPVAGGARGDRAAVRRRADGAGDGRGAGGAADHR